MKKLLVCLCSILILAGCSGGSKKSETKECSIKAGGVPVNIEMNSTNNVIGTMQMKMVLPSSIFKGVDVSKITNDQLNSMGDTFIKGMGLNGKKGVTAKYTLQNKEVHVDVSIDLKNGDASTLNKFGITGNIIKLNNTVKQFEKEGATCK